MVLRDRVQRPKLINEKRPEGPFFALPLAMKRLWEDSGFRQGTALAVP
jgi:hypothetical protein